MKKNNLISIIIPVYNAEKYIKYALDNILMQSNKDFEVIIIDDGSTDNTKSICKEYIKNSNKVKYFYKKNGGVSSARNYGLTKAKGKYICFIDADDMICSNYLSDFINEIEKSNCEMVCCQYKKIKTTETTNDVKTNYSDTSITVYYGEERFNLLFSSYAGYLWNKIFIKEIIDKNNIKFNENIKMCEDMLFIYEYLKHIKTVLCINHENYLYRIFENSASKNLKNKNWFTIFDVFENILNDDFNYSEKFRIRAKYAYYHYIFEGKYRCNFVDDQKIRKHIIELNKKTRILNERFNIKQKIKLLFYKYFNRIAFNIKK